MEPNNRPVISSPWRSTNDSLPEEGKYVLIHLSKDNWHDGGDPVGVNCKVAKLKLGISLEQRALLRLQEEADGMVAENNGFGSIWPGRSGRYAFGDEGMGNCVPWAWDTFGPSKYFGQDVDLWMEIPPIQKNKS